MINGQIKSSLDLKSRINIDNIANTTYGNDINKDRIVIMTMPGLFEEDGK